MSVVPTLFSDTARIGLSPWSAAAMDPDEYASLETRAEALGVIVSCFRRSDKQWMVRASRGETCSSLVGRGPVAAIIAGALDDWEARDA